MRRVDIEELEARINSGDRSFLSWLKSAERRNQFLPTYNNSAGTRFLSVFWRKVLAVSPGLTMVLNIGCGTGSHADGLLRVQGSLRYVGMDYDPECIRRCRQRFLALPGFQFHNIDYLKPPNLPRKFSYIVFTHVFNGLPSYTDLLRSLWDHCEDGMMILFSDPLVSRTNDLIQIDPVERKLWTTYSYSKFVDFCASMSEFVEMRTIFSDDSQSREHIALVKTRDGSPTMGGLHHFAENGLTFPYSEEGLL